MLRLLDKHQAIRSFEQLGFVGETLRRFKELVHHPLGLVLVTGPTGSGKTTTLYTAIDALNTMEKNILTVEDRVEYQLELINQLQVRHAIGLSFARILRSVLRQDSDVIMVGEIRNCETAEIAIQAALTRHLALQYEQSDLPSLLQEGSSKSSRRSRPSKKSAVQCTSMSKNVLQPPMRRFRQRGDAHQGWHRRISGTIIA